MGSLCVGKQKKQKAKITIQKEQTQNEVVQVQKLETRERQVTFKKRSFVLNPTYNQQCEDLVEPTALGTMKLLEAYKKLQGLLDLLGSLDQLPQSTREYLNQLIILRSNVSILIKNTVKKALRNLKIIKKPDDGDEKLLYNDQQFSKDLVTQMEKVVETLNTLEINPEFESAFPILSFSFINLKEQITTILQKDIQVDLKLKNDQNNQEVLIKNIQKKSTETKEKTNGLSSNIIVQF